MDTVIGDVVGGPWSPQHMTRGDLPPPVIPDSRANSLVWNLVLGRGARPIQLLPRPRWPKPPEHGHLRWISTNTLAAHNHPWTISPFRRSVSVLKTVAWASQVSQHFHCQLSVQLELLLSLDLVLVDVAALAVLGWAPLPLPSLGALSWQRLWAGRGCELLRSLRPASVSWSVRMRLMNSYGWLIEASL